MRLFNKLFKKRYIRIEKEFLEMHNFLGKDHIVLNLPTGNKGEYYHLDIKFKLVNAFTGEDINA